MRFPPQGSSGSRWESYDATTITPKGGKGIRVEGTTTFAGAIVASGQIQAGDGSAAAPSYSYSAETTTGRYRSGGEVLSIGGSAYHKWAAGYYELYGANPYIVFGSADTPILIKDAANVLAQRNSTNAQTFRIYNTYTDASNYERGGLKWNGNQLELFTDAAGTGSNRAIYINAGTGQALYFGVAGNYWQITSAGHLIVGSTDNTYDLGASGAYRPRTGYFGTSIYVDSFRLYTAFGRVHFETGSGISPIALLVENVQFRSDTRLGWLPGTNHTASVDAMVVRKGAATLHLGDFDGATPVAQTLGVQGARGGTDTNVGGANLTIRSGIGTGTGTLSKLVLITPTLGASGTTAQTMDSAFVCFGGATNAFVALKRSGTDLYVRLADDTGYGGLWVGNLRFNSIGIYDSAGVKVIGAQGAAVADASGGATVDAEARTAINTLLARLRTHGLIAT